MRSALSRSATEGAAGAQRARAPACAPTHPQAAASARRHLLTRRRRSSGGGRAALPLLSAPASRTPTRAAPRRRLRLRARAQLQPAPCSAARRPALPRGAAWHTRARLGVGASACSAARRRAAGGGVGLCSSTQPYAQCKQRRHAATESGRGRAFEKHPVRVPPLPTNARVRRGMQSRCEYAFAFTARGPFSRCTCALCAPSASTRTAPQPCTPRSRPGR